MIERLPFRRNINLTPIAKRALTAAGRSRKCPMAVFAHRCRQFNSDGADLTAGFDGLGWGPPHIAGMLQILFAKPIRRCELRTGAQRMKEDMVSLLAVCDQRGCCLRLSLHVPGGGIPTPDGARWSR
jgi:hypothetical protein